MDDGPMLLVVIGLVQLLYLIPAWIILRVKGQKRTALGIVICAAITFLLNAGCWGLIAVMFQNLH